MVIAEPFEPHIGWLPVMVHWKQLMMKFFLEFFPHNFFYLLIYYDFLKQTYFSYFFRCAKVRTVCNGYSFLNGSVSVHVRTVYVLCTYCRVTSKRSCRRSVSFFLCILKGNGVADGCIAINRRRPRCHRAGIPISRTQTCTVLSLTHRSCTKGFFPTAEMTVIVWTRSGTAPVDLRVLL